jgi:hypothetical protein
MALAVLNATGLPLMESQHHGGKSWERAGTGNSPSLFMPFMKSQ